MKVSLIPLDERPVNTRYPRMLAEIAGAELLLPPADILSDFRMSAQSRALVDWLEQIGPGCDALIVSTEMLGYGSLIQSRISEEPVGTVLARLETLRNLKRHKPNVRIFGFSLIARISRGNSATEEPLYWADHGANMYRFSQLLDMLDQGQDVGSELERLRSQLPDDCVRDFISRRLRNHIVNLAVLQMAADGVFDLLVVSSDDTSPYGLGTREKRWVSEWVGRLDLGNKLLMYPGADEVGSVLVARALLDGRGPTFEVDYAVPGGDAITAAFEDSAVRVTVERQIRAAGAAVVEHNGDILLVVNPPRSSEWSWPAPYTEDELERRASHLSAATTRIAEQVSTGRIVAVADVAHANGADALWVDGLRKAGVFTNLAAYSAWNTAGNSIGTTVAQACIAWRFGRDSTAQRQFLAHRLIEDWAYQCVVRDQANLWIHQQTGKQDPPAELIPATARWIEAKLGEVVDRDLADLDFRIVPGSLRLPWSRTFEIDFELAPKS